LDIKLLASIATTVDDPERVSLCCTDVLGAGKSKLCEYTLKDNERPKIRHTNNLLFNTNENLKKSLANKFIVY
jgi:hypothetical protein